MTTLDDDRRDIAVMGSESAWELNRLAHRNHGADPLPISGDAITRHENGIGSPAKNSPDAEEHNTQKEDEMPITQSMRLEGSNKEGKEFSFDVTHIDEANETPYITVEVGCTDFGPTFFCIEPAQLQTLADWLSGAAAKFAN